MNRIKASLDELDYGDNIRFLNFQIDGFWLDEKLEELYPGNNYKGLVPTLDPSINSEEEKEIVWERILPAEGETTICPILMCPDDCDFSCTLILAEIENWGETILWNRIGFNQTPSFDPTQVGSKVEWFYKMGVLEFDSEDYLEMLVVFKEKLRGQEELK